MASNLLFIFEGKRTEDEIVANITDHFNFEPSLIKCIFDADIYQLYKLISADEDLDTFSLIKSRYNNTDVLQGYTRNDFAEIYLFFDYDGYATLADDTSISDLLKIFNQETETGRLLISYPMAEAIKHLGGGGNFQDLKVKCKENIKYKQIVGDTVPHHLCALKRLSKDAWSEILNQHLKKMNYVVNDEFTIPTRFTPQDVIFESQLYKYIKKDQTVAVLSSFPIFLFDYYGYEFISTFIADST